MTANQDHVPIDTLVRPFQTFARHKGSGAIMLLGATLVALLWANSPWSRSYFELLAIPFTVGAEGFLISKPLLLWINDGLMGIFFFVIGLELKRELMAGHLAVPRRALLPMVAAVGGMLVPAAVFAVISAGGPGSHAWGVPMATDIAFALGILILVGGNVPTSIKVFLAALAIVDDLGAILVIAIFYTEKVALAPLGLGLVCFLISIAANKAGVRNQVVFFLLGTVVWIGFLKSGVHATLAAVLMAFTIPARTRHDGQAFVDRMSTLLQGFRDSGPVGGRELKSPAQQAIFEKMTDLLDEASAPLQRLEHTLMPLITFLVLPIFALANAGVVLEGDLGAAIFSPTAVGIFCGLFVGKQVGILSFSWLAVRLGWASLPEGASWRHIHAVGVLAGIGFTMALFISELGLQDPQLLRSAKLGVLLASVVSALVGAWLLRRLPVAAPPRAVSST